CRRSQESRFGLVLRVLGLRRLAMDPPISVVLPLRPLRCILLRLPPASPASSAVRSSSLRCAFGDGAPSGGLRVGRRRGLSPCAGSSGAKVTPGEPAWPDHDIERRERSR